MESLAQQLQNAPGVSSVSIKSGRRQIDFGTPEGPPRSSWSTGTGMTIEVWGEDSPFVDALLELARLVDHRDQEIDDLAEALTQANDRQLRLFELSRMNVDSLDRASTVERVLLHGLELTEASVASLVWSNGTVMSCSTDQLESKWLEDAGRAALVEGNLRKPMGSRGTYALMAPVKVGADTHVLALGRKEALPFGTAERKVIDALAGSLGSALRLVEMHETALQQAITENEHNTAAALAGTVLPKSVMPVPGINAFATCIPARSVGGDFFTSDSSRGSLRFAIGDVAGKGLPAAVLMTNAITSTNTVFRNDESLGAMSLLASIHDALEQLLVGTNRFITMLVGVATADPARPGTVSLSLANAGHSPVIVSVGGSIIHVPPCAPPVGVGRRPSGEPFEIELAGADWLVTGSDGLLEQDGLGGDMFGQTRLESLINGDISAAALADKILSAVQEFGEGMPASDDQTVFTLRPVGGPMNQEPAAHTAAHSIGEAGDADEVDSSTPHLVMEASLERVRALATWLPDAVAKLAPEHADDLVGLIELAIHELCINITEHAYAEWPGNIAITATRNGDQLVFDVSDTGKQFDPSGVAVPDPERPSIRGYGLMIINQLASDVRYVPVDGGNRWSVSFSIPSGSQ
jgi:serine phosphatase RsbU (regulator of sigma subunit)/anti-sigma regulatory factor (Ser/Thr protein kinase)